MGDSQRSQSGEPETDAGGAGPDGELGGATAVHADVHQWIFWNIYTIIPRVNLALLGHQPYQH